MKAGFQFSHISVKKPGTFYTAGNDKVVLYPLPGIKSG